MDDKKLNDVVSQIIEHKKKFNQSVDLIINLKNLDLKNPDHQVEFFLKLPKHKGKKAKICCFIGPELGEQSKFMDATVLQHEFDKYQKDVKLTKKLAREHDWFVAQATLMPKVATVFGRILGPKGKMPNPKAGCIVPPNANLKAVYDRLQDTIKISAKKAPLVQTIVAKQDAPKEHILENIKFVYSNLVHHLPQGENNIKSVYLKTTMGSPVRVM